MELKEAQRKYVKKNVRLVIRCSKDDSEFMTKNNISPQLFWDIAFREFKREQEKPSMLTTKTSFKSFMIV